MTAANQDANALDNESSKMCVSSNLRQIVQKLLTRLLN